MMTELRVETWPIGRVVPYARNPRKNDAAVARMAGAIAEFGFRIPLVAKSDGSLVDGHLRLKAAIKLGMSSVPVAIADGLSDAQIKAFRLLANRSATWADWDDDLLRLELEELNAIDFDLSLTGFDAKELDALMAGVGGDATDDDTPEAPTIAATKPGDLWLLGDHRLLCGDATSADDLARLLDGRSADLCFTSPPYGLGLDYGTYQDTFDNCRALLRAVAPRIFDSLRPGGFCVTNFGDISAAKSINGTVVPSEFPMAVEYWPIFTGAGFALHTRRVWAKPHARVPARWCASSNRAASDWEHLWTWLKPGGQFLNERRDNSALGVWDSCKIEGVDVGKADHPAAFPVGIARLVLMVYSNRGDIVFEPFGGTGTTMIAAERTWRIACLTEIDPRFCDVIVMRWQTVAGKAATLEGDGRTFDEVKAERNALPHPAPEPAPVKPPTAKRRGRAKA